MSDPSLQATVFVRMFGAVSYGLLATNGIVLNILLILVFLQSKSTLNKIAFYTISWQLICCDLGIHLAELIVSVPITAAGYDLYGETLVLYIPCFMDTLCYCGTLLFSLLMTTNRITYFAVGFASKYYFRVFLLPNINKLLFQYYLYSTIICTWMFGVIVASCLHLLACYKSFNSQGFHYYYVCPKWDTVHPIGYYIFWGYFHVTGYIPVVMFIAYLIMIAIIKVKLNFDYVNGKWRRKTAAGQQGQIKIKKEFNLLAQSFLICGFLEVGTIAFSTIPQFPASGQWTFLKNIFGGWIGLLVNSIHPIVLFTFNHEIRNRLKELFGKRSGHNSIQTVGAGSRNKPAFKYSSFYSIALQLVCCDLLSHFTNFSVAVPITLVGYNFYGLCPIYSFICFLQTFAYAGTLYFSLLLTLNRFFVFIASRVNTVVFGKRTTMTICFVWVLLLCFLISLSIFSCTKSFNDEGFYFENICLGDEHLSLLGLILKKIYKGGSSWLPIVMFAVYVIIIVYVKFKLRFRIQNGRIKRRLISLHNESVANKRERNLLIQSFVVCGFFVVEKVTFNALPRIQSGGQLEYILRFIGAWITVLLNSIHPIVLFTFNRDIQRQLQTLVKPRTSRASVPPSSRENHCS